MEARARLLAAAGHSTASAPSLDQVAREAVPEESVDAALRALFPSLSPPVATELAAFLALQRANA